MIINSPLPRIEHNSISGHYSELIGEFYNNRRSVAHRCSGFAYSFASLMLRQYYWCCDSYSANRRSMANRKKSAKKYYYQRGKCAPLCQKPQRVRPTLPISAGRHAAPILLAVYSIGCPAKLVSFRYNRNRNRKKFRNYPKQKDLFRFFRNIPKLECFDSFGCFGSTKKEP